ncbi:protein DPCD [Episyrphus balteatus]|uniref:protein DPCD n=1 Tax=Episyrphus balteatus TaxID=286459 RepID=UPI002485D389|nr:protein DPCD [Episyrphus balteatus]
MSYTNWLKDIRDAEKNSMISGRVRKVFYKFVDGRQMAEEYSLDTGVIQKRAWKKSKNLMGEADWELELGEVPNLKLNTENPDEGFIVRQSETEPILSKRVTKHNIEWRIRNLPHPIETYQVTADETKRAIIVRTTNKKYYKTIEVPELERCSLLPEQDNISIHHQYNTLIITYKKPQLLCEMEAQVLLILKDVETETDMEEMLQGLLAK